VLGQFPNQIGDITLGNTKLGEVGEELSTYSNLFANTTKGITLAMDSTAISSFNIYKKINLTIATLSTTTTTFTSTKGIDLAYASTSTGTVIFVPDYDGIVGKSRADGEQDATTRADGERIFILRAEGEID
jgi:hypothetical protein